MRGFIRPVLPKLIAVLVLISTCTAMIFTLVSCSSDRFDFMNENLSKYVKISEEDYRGYTVTVNIKEPGDIRTAIAKLRCQIFDGQRLLEIGINVGNQCR